MEPANTPTGAPAETANAETVLMAVRSLRTQFLAILILLAVLGVSINLVLFKAFRVTHRQVQELDHIVNQNLSEFNANARPRISDFLSKIKEYSKTHPDINPMLANYSIQVSNPPAPAIPPAPTPAVPSAQTNLPKGR